MYVVETSLVSSKLVDILRLDWISSNLSEKSPLRTLGELISEKSKQSYNLSEYKGEQGLVLVVCEVYMTSMDKRDQSNSVGCHSFTGSLQKVVAMLLCKAWAYGLDSISGCKAALEGSLRVRCEESLAAL